MIDYQKQLNNEQYNVVKNGDGHCLVLAGAGSGKTRTVTYRVAYLLEQGILPDEILLVTFTNKAAKEMTNRIQTILGGDVKLKWAGTFHHISYRILRAYAGLLGYQNNFTILDSEDSRDLLKICLKIEGAVKDKKRFPSARVVQSIISFAKSSQQTPGKVLKDKYPHWEHHEDMISRVATEYARRKKEANAMDFDDLLVNLFLLLQKSQDVRNKFAGKFKYVMVDEYQDTNKIQADIIRLFCSVHNNLLVVGDDAQSIYSFRAAEIENILNFESFYDDTKIFKLETNYRSTPDILEVANDVIANNARQFKKELNTTKKSFTKPEIHACENQQQEAIFIADRILELRDEGVELDQIAVLFRAAFHSQSLEMELTKRDIPYDFRGGVRFFERTHVKDVLAYLKIFSNIGDTIALSRMLNKQTGIGPATANKIITKLLVIKSGLETNDPKEVLKHFDEITDSLSIRAKIGWREFAQIYRLIVEAETDDPGVLIQIVKDSTYREYLEAEFPNHRERLQDIDQLAIFAQKTPELDKFLAEATLQESYIKPIATSYEEEEGAVVLSTIHQAKGLEWGAVFIINVSQGQFPNDRATKEKDGMEEERRLFYVAVTRAQNYLYLSYPLLGGFDTKLQGPSVFINEISKSLIDEHHAFDTGIVWSDPSDDVDDVVYVSEEQEYSQDKSNGLLSDFGGWEF